MAALSSAEAKYLAMVKGVHEALALRTALLELGVETYITIYTDSAAAKASAEKPGLMHMKRTFLEADCAARIGDLGKSTKRGEPSRPPCEGNQPEDC